MYRSYKSFAVAMLTIVICLIISVITEASVFGLYPKIGIVSEVWEEDNETVIEVVDYSDNVWEFADDDEVWYTAEVAALLMFDNGTAEIEDDMILFGCGIK